MKLSAASLALLALAASCAVTRAQTSRPEGLLMPLCETASTYATSLSEGYYFIAPTDFCILGLMAPAKVGHPSEMQTVQVINFANSAPPEMPGSSGETVFYESQVPLQTTIPTKIQVQSGDVVGLLGTTSNWCSEEEFTSSIDGMPVTLHRLGALSIGFYEYPASLFWRKSYGSMTNLDMFYVPGACPAAPAPCSVPSASSAPSMVPSNLPSMTNLPSMMPPTQAPPVVCLECGNCLEERAGETHCECDACERAVCQFDPFCCEFEWDFVCVAWVGSLCDCNAPSPSSSPSTAPVCLEEDCGDCTKARDAEATCECDACQELVCNYDAWCCKFHWDSYCVQHAHELCQCRSLSIAPMMEQPLGGGLRALRHRAERD